MRRHLVLAALIASALGACSVKPLQLRLPDELVGAVPWPVSGRQGWQIGREIRFGDYRSTPVGAARIRTRTHACPTGCPRVDLGLYQARFDEALSQSKSALDFKLLAPGGVQARLQAVGEMDQQRREWVTRWMGLPAVLESELARSISFVGTVEPDSPGYSAWRFVVWESAGGIAPGSRHGWAEDGQGRRITLQSLDRWHGDRAAVPNPALPGLHLGYAFVMDGRAIAAVETVGDGVLWMHDGLSPDLRLAVASLSSALLLRTDLGALPPPRRPR